MSNLPSQLTWVGLIICFIIKKMLFINCYELVEIYVTNNLVKNNLEKNNSVKNNLAKNNLRQQCNLKLPRQQCNLKLPRQ